jgi:general secretion pathway protein A
LPGPAAEPVSEVDGDAVVPTSAEAPAGEGEEGAPELMARASLAAALEVPVEAPAEDFTEVLAEVSRPAGPEPATVKPAAVEPAAPPPPAIVAVPDLSRVALDRRTAVTVLLRRWGVDLSSPGQGDPCGRVASFGLLCEAGRGDWTEVAVLGRPVLLRVADGAGHRGYAVVGETAGEAVTLDLPEGEERVALDGLIPLWNGDFLVIWQPPPFGGGLIGPRAPRESVRWLRKMLSQVPDMGLTDTTSGRYDRALTDAVRLFQAREGLVTDGIAGPRTLIRLNDALAMPGVPRLLPES